MAESKYTEAKRDKNKYPTWHYDEFVEVDCSSDSSSQNELDETEEYFSDPLVVDGQIFQLEFLPNKQDFIAICIHRMKLTCLV